MRIRVPIAAAVMLVFVQVLPAAAETSGKGSPSFTITEASTTVAKVAAVDYQARTVTLEGDGGNTQTVKVSDAVRNFNQVKKGDMVTIEAHTTVSVEVQPGPGEPMNIGSESQTAALPGAKPSGIRTIEGKLKTRVEAIDYNARTITFKGRDGNMKTYRIGQDAKQFNEIRRNDMLIIEYTQTVAASVK